MVAVRGPGNKELACTSFCQLADSFNSCIFSPNYHLLSTEPNEKAYIFLLMYFIIRCFYRGSSEMHGEDSQQTLMTTIYLSAQSTLASAINFKIVNCFIRLNSLQLSPSYNNFMYCIVEKKTHFKLAISQGSES